MKQTTNYTKKEEIANSITHGIGIIFGVVALTILVIFSAIKGNAWHVVSVSIYGATLVILYTMSTLYHAFSKEKVKKLFKIFDHQSIYLLIAGTYTPFTLVILRDDGIIGWTIFGVIWLMAIIGVILSGFLSKKYKFLTVICTLVMGWVIVFAMKPLIQNFNSMDLKPSLYFLIAGGLFYTLGTIFYVFKKIPYFHMIWHIFVLLGSISHFISIYYII